MIITVVTIIVLLVLSGIFSGSETAFFHVKSNRENISEKVKFLLENPRRLLVSFLTGNTIVNVALTSLATVITVDLAEKNQWNEHTMIIVEIFAVTLVILIFGEIFPKLIAIRNSEDFANKVQFPVRILVALFYPIAVVFYTITKGILKILPFRGEKIFDSEEELKILTEISEEQGTLQSEESEMIQSIFEFKDKTVHEIMIPRVDMTAIPSNTSLDAIMDIIKDQQFSKIPIYKNTIDDIKGILYAKDLIPYLLGSRPDINLTTLARTPFFVPENKNLDELLLDFKEKRTNIAIVVDEWGGTSGLVTLEDVVEEVVGEIQDPFDKEKASIKILEDNSIMADASISIYDLEEETDIEYPEPEDRDFDTLGGLILELVGDIPKVDDSVDFQNRTYTVKSLSGNRINKVHISVEHQQEMDEVQND